MITESGRSATTVPKGSFLVLFKIQLKLSIREPYGLGLGIIFPIILLVVFGFIGKAVGGDFSGLSLFDLYVPTIIVIGFISIALNSIPITLVRDREIGWLRRVSTTPLSPARLLASQFIVNLIYALVTLIIILMGSYFVFGAPLNIGIFYFVISIILSLAVSFSIGFLVAAIAPSQRFATALSGAFFYPLLFLSGLWVQPAMVGNPLRSIMWYSPAGAAVRSLLFALFNQAPPYLELVAMMAWTAFFGLIALKYFRWE